MKPPFDISESLAAKARQIKLAVFDIDGVLTDGSLIYGADGEQLKVFHAHDGLGLKMAQQAGIEIAIISARDSAPLRTRLNDLGIRHQLLGCHQKLEALKSLSSELGITAEQCCFTGDDIIDLEAMQYCGLAITVPNGHFLVQNSAHWVTPHAGGNGAARDVCDMLLFCQQKLDLATPSIQ